MSDDKKRRGSKSSEGDSNLSSSFEGFSRSLDNHTTALKSLETQFGEVMSKFNADFSKSVDKLIKEYTDATSDLTSSFEKRAKESGDNPDDKPGFDISREMSKRDKVDKQKISVMKQVGAKVVKTLVEVGTYIAGKYLEAADQVEASYESHLSTIVTKMNMTETQYSNMYNEVSAYFQSKKLDKQWSPVDFANEMENVLSTGLRGYEAKQMTYQNLIMQKLIPAISTNTASYRRMSKTFGQAYNENTAALAKYTQDLYGAEGLEEGKYDAMIETLHRDIIYAVGQKGGSAEDAERVNAALTLTTSKLEDMGLDAQNFVDLMSKAANNPADTDTLLQLGVRTPDEFNKMLTSTEGVAQMAENYLKTLSGFAENGTKLAYTSDPLQLDTQQAKAAWSAQNVLGEDLNNFSEEVNANISKFRSQSKDMYADQISALEDGWGQAKQDEQAKHRENVMTALGVIQGELGDMKDIFGIILNGVLDIVSIIIGGKLLNNITGGKLGKGLGKLLGKGTTEGAAKTGSLLGKNVKGGIPTATKVTGGAMLAAGLYMGAEDAADNVKVVQENGGSTGKMWAQGARGFFTGGSTDSLNDQLDKADNALNGQKVEFDWGEMFSNAGKGALIGGGIGSFIPGIGTGIGAAVGSITGAISNAIDQWAENKEYNELADAVNEYSESLGNAKISVDAYTKTVKKSKDTEELLRAMEKGSAEEKEESLRVLKEVYGLALANVEDVSDWDSKYADIIERKVKLEKELSASKALSDIGTALEDLKTVEDEANDVGSDKLLNSYVYDFAKEVGGEDSDTANDLEAFNALVKKYADLAGVSEEEFVNMANKATGGALINSTDDMAAKNITWKVGESKPKWYAAGNDKYDGGFGTSGDNYSDLYNNDYIKDEYGNVYLKTGGKEALHRISEQANERYSKIEDAWEAIKAFSDNHLDENGNYNFDGLNSNAKTLLESDLVTFDESVKSFNNDMRSRGLHDFYLEGKAFDKYLEITKAIGHAQGFKLGLNKVPYDNMIAKLHKGEMVLTAANAEKLRNIQGSGLSGILSLIEGMAGVQAKPVHHDNTRQYHESLVGVIQAQTKTLNDTLNMIYNLLAGKLNPESTVNPDNSATPA